MFISENEYLLAGTNDGYISAKKVNNEWVISLPPGQKDNPRFAGAESRFAAVLADLEANTIPLEIIQVKGNIQNMASGRTMSQLRSNADARVQMQREKQAEKQSKVKSKK